MMTASRFHRNAHVCHIRGRSYRASIRDFHAAKVPTRQPVYARSNPLHAAAAGTRLQPLDMACCGGSAACVPKPSGDSEFKDHGMMLPEKRKCRDVFCCLLFLVFCEWLTLTAGSWRCGAERRA